MEYSRITVSQTDALWELQKAYKAEIEEEIPTKQDLNRPYRLGNLISNLASRRIRLLFQDGKHSHFCPVQSDIQSDAGNVTLKLRPIQRELEAELIALIGKADSGILAQAVDTLKSASKLFD